jgi:hypothetical protein
MPIVSLFVRAVRCKGNLGVPRVTNSALRHTLSECAAERTRECREKAKICTPLNNESPKMGDEYKTGETQVSNQNFASR